MAEIELHSPAFAHDGRVPDEYSHARGDVTPPLTWTGAPTGTAEYALLCEDPDAPGGTFVHWLLTGIPGSTTGFSAGNQPADAVPGSNGFGGRGYGGPHPPPGDSPHRYVFRLYALSEPVRLGPGYSASELRQALEGKVLAQGELVGTYGR